MFIILKNLEFQTNQVIVINYQFLLPLEQNCPIQLKATWVWNVNLDIFWKNDTSTLAEELLRPVRLFFLENLSHCPVITDCTFIRDIRVNCHHPPKPHNNSPFSIKQTFFTGHQTGNLSVHRLTNQKKITKPRIHKRFC